MTTGCTPKYNQQTRELRDQLEKLNTEHAELSRNEKRLAAIAKRSQAADVTMASDNRDRPAPRERIPYNSEVQRAQTALNRKIAALEEFYAKGERMKRSGPQKVYSAIRDTFMASILASFKVYGKLAGAVGAGHVSSLIADATRTAAKTLIPGVRGIANQAPRYGVGINPRALAARAKGAVEAPREAYNQMKYGQAAMESAHGKINKMSDEYFTFAGTLKDAWQTPGLMNKISETARTVSSYVGRTHAAEKEFLVQPERRETEYRVSEHLAKSLKEQGLSQEEAQHYMTQDTVQAAIGARAVERGYDAKMQGKNAINTGIDAMVGTWARSKNAGANFGAFLFNMIEPVRKIGMNIADRQLHNLGGSAYALREAMGKDKMTPERADYIMENIGRQGVGAAMLAIGALYYTKFGGVPGVFSKKDSPRKKDEEGNLLKPGESEWVGTEAFHSAEFGLLQIGASMADVYHKEYGRKKGPQLAIDTILSPVGNWFIRTIPYTDTARRWAATAYRGRGEKEGLPGTVSEIAGNMAGGFIPGAVRNVAQWTDDRPGYYRPRNFAEQIEQGVPYLNQNVPKRP